MIRKVITMQCLAKCTKHKRILFSSFLLIVVTVLCGFDSAEYKDLHWQDPQKPRIILAGKKYVGDIRTIPNKTELLKVSFSDGAITVDTEQFYKLDIPKKEVIVNFYGIRSDKDGVRLEKGKETGEEWNVYSMNIKGTPGSQVVMIFVGRKNDKKSYRVEKKFTLDGTDQKLVFEKEFPNDLETFGLRMDLRSSGTFTFSSPNFEVKKKDVVNE